MQVEDEKLGGADSSTNEIVDELQPAVKAAPQSHTDKPQFAASDSDSDKEHIAQARGEAPANSHRAEPGTPTSASADTSLAARSNCRCDPIGNGQHDADRNYCSHKSDRRPLGTSGSGGPLQASHRIAGALAGKNRFEIRASIRPNLAG